MGGVADAVGGAIGDVAGGIGDVVGGIPVIGDIADFAVDQAGNLLDVPFLGDALKFGSNLILPGIGPVALGGLDAMTGSQRGNPLLGAAGGLGGPLGAFAGGLGSLMPGMARGMGGGGGIAGTGISGGDILKGAAIGVPGFFLAKQLAELTGRQGELIDQQSAAAQRAMQVGNNLLGEAAPLRHAGQQGLMSLMGSMGGGGGFGRFAPNLSGLADRGNPFRQNFNFDLGFSGGGVPFGLTPPGMHRRPHGLSTPPGIMRPPQISPPRTRQGPAVSPPLGHTPGGVASMWDMLRERLGPTGQTAFSPLSSPRESGGGIMGTRDMLRSRLQAMVPGGMQPPAISPPRQRTGIGVSAGPSRADLLGARALAHDRISEILSGGNDVMRSPPQISPPRTNPAGIGVQRTPTPPRISPPRTSSSPVSVTDDRKRRLLSGRLGVAY